MQSLWAPWRMEYILADKSATECIFCAKSHAAEDVKNRLLLRDRICFAILNIYPYSNGHLMVAPYKHTQDLEELTESEMAELLSLVRRCQQILRKAFKPDGFNIGVNIGKAAGAGIEGHLHIHVVPRWNGDSNFMTTVSDVRVIPESLD